MRNTSQKVWITGMGTVNCTGKSPHELWQGVLEKRSFIADGFGPVSPALVSSLQKKLPPSLPLAERAHKFTLMTVYSIYEAMQMAGWERLTADDAIFFATTTGQIPLWENDLMDYLEGKISPAVLAETLRYEPLGLALKNVLEMIGGRECYSQIISTACSASTQALVLASLWLQDGRARRCLVGGTELLCQLTGAGFQSLKLLSSEPATPFDQNRRGINLAEASAFLCLETEPKNSVLAQLSGGGLSSDGHHMTSPNPDGEGIGRAMAMAVLSAGLRHEQIDWIHAHGTGSVANDEAEIKAIKRLFAHCPPPVSSTKPVHGHTLAVSGVLESIICLLAMQNRVIPPTRGLMEQDWGGDLSFPKEAQHLNINHVLKNSLGFGGANAAVVYSTC